MRVVAFDRFRNIPPRKYIYLAISIDNPTPPASAQEKAGWPRTESPLPYLRFIRRQMYVRSTVCKPHTDLIRSPG